VALPILGKGQSDRSPMGFGDFAERPQFLIPPELLDESIIAQQQLMPGLI
jgi:hypothetical protein